MAKKPANRRRSVVASSSKVVKSSGKKTKAPQKSYGKSTPKKISKPAKSSKKRISYKDEYVKLLQKTNKTLTKELRATKEDVKAIRKAIEYHPEAELPFEAFPKEEPIKPTPAQPVVSPESIEAQILETLQDIEMQIRSRDMAFEDLISGSAYRGGMEGMND